MVYIGYQALFASLYIGYQALFASLYTGIPTIPTVVHGHTHHTHRCTHGIYPGVSHTGIYPGVSHTGIYPGVTYGHIYLRVGYTQLCTYPRGYKAGFSPFPTFPG